MSFFKTDKKIEYALFKGFYYIKILALNS